MLGWKGACPFVLSSDLPKRGGVTLIVDANSQCVTAGHGQLNETLPRGRAG